MKREEAIKDLDIIRFNPHWDELVNEEYWKELMEMAITALQNQPVWIPVSERLPEKNKKVIIFTKTENLYIGTYCQNIDKAQDGVFLIRDNIYMQIDRIAAWMPLPEPYRESEVENGK